MKFRYCFLYLCCTGIIVSCSADSGEVPDWYINTNCDAPCWQDIIPGKSSLPETVQLLSQSQDIAPDSINVHGEAWNGFNEVIDYRLLANKDIQGWTYFRDNLVSLITFNDTEQGTNGLAIELGDIIDAYGEPDGIVRTGFTGRGPFPWTDQMRTFVYVIFTEKGIAAGYDETSLPKRQHLIVSANIELKILQYFFPNDFQFLSDNGTFSLGNFDAVKTMQHFQAWHGYGEYSP